MFVIVRGMFSKPFMMSNETLRSCRICFSREGRNVSQKFMGETVDSLIYLRCSSIEGVRQLSRLDAANFYL